MKGRSSVTNNFPGGAHTENIAGYRKIQNVLWQNAAGRQELQKTKTPTHTFRFPHQPPLPHPLSISDQSDHRHNRATRRACTASLRGCTRSGRTWYTAPCLNKAGEKGPQSSSSSSSRTSRDGRNTRAKYPRSSHLTKTSQRDRHHIAKYRTPSCFLPCSSFTEMTGGSTDSSSKPHR